MRSETIKGSETAKVVVWVAILTVALSAIAIAFWTAPPIPEYVKLPYLEKWFILHLFCVQRRVNTRSTPAISALVHDCGPTNSTRFWLH